MKIKYHDFEIGRADVWAATRGLSSGSIRTIIKKGDFDKALVGGRKSKKKIFNFYKADEIFADYIPSGGHKPKVKFQKFNCKYCGDLFYIRKNEKDLAIHFRKYCSNECFILTPVKCSCCGKTLSPDKFYKRMDSQKGIKSRCIKCDYKQSQNFLKNNPKKRSGYQKKHKLKHKKEIKEKRKKEVANLDDTYVRRVLARYSTLSESDFPQWMIDLKRSELKLHRAMKKKGISTSIKNVI